jgi:lipopolysaccharide export LptBFGC system permease protein LptF
MSTFDKIDEYLKDKKSSEVSLVFFMIFAVIAVIVYLYVFPITEKNLKQTKRAVLNMNQKLNQERSYLRSITVNGDKEFYIKKMQQEIRETKILLEKTSYENAYVDSKLKELSYLLFNDKNWANFLDSIAFLAKQNHINIQSIKNEFTKLDFQKIDKVLNVTVDFSGSFQNILKFINSLEESQLVVDIYELNLKSSNTIEGTLNIAVWGMKY